MLGVYTIDDPKVARVLVGMGVDVVITDAPDVILAALGQAHGSAGLWPAHDAGQRPALPNLSCVLYTALVDCHQTEIKQTHRSLGTHRYTAGS